MRLHPTPAIDAALQRAYSTHPYYASALGRLRIVADKSVPTMATSADWVTHYNPETVRGWTVAETSAVIVHELEHLLRRHEERCGDRDHKGWNIAGDAEINQRLANLPDGAVYPETLGMPRGQTAEVYYAATGGGRMPKPKPGGDKPGQGQGQGGATPGQGGDCGSCAGGPTRPHERGDATNPGAGAADPNGVRKDTAQRVLGDHTIGQGAEPGDSEGNSILQWAETEVGINRAGWYRALATVLGHELAPYGAQTRWAWPGRRDSTDLGGAVLPRWTGTRPSCAVVIDTSSSITPYDLNLARAAGYYVGRLSDVTYYGCDTVPTPYGRDLPERIYGGGGTDMMAGIQRAIEDGAKAVIVITDCETSWPQRGSEPLPVPVIIAANVQGSRHIGPDGGRVDYWTPPEWMTVLPIVNERPE
jgi:hypothetical protein